MDDCWHASGRDPKTNAPLADPVKFPNGIKALADSVHALGLKVRHVLPIPSLFSTSFRTQYCADRTDRDLQRRWIVRLLFTFTVLITAL